MVSTYVLAHSLPRSCDSHRTDLDPQESASYAVSCVWLDGRITRFWETLPPLHTFYADSATACTLVLAHAMTAAAVIKLHRSPGSVDPEAQNKCVFAARAILASLGDMRVPDCTIAHPIAGALLRMACSVLMEAVRRGQAFRSAWGESFGVESPPSGAEEVALASDLRDGIIIMRVYALESPLVSE